LYTHRVYVANYTSVTAKVSPQMMAIKSVLRWEVRFEMDNTFVIKLIIVSTIN